MSEEGELIVCRKCKETIVMAEGTCHHCGTDVKSDLPYILGVIVGLLLVVVTPFNLDELIFFGVLGLLLAVICGYMLYEKRQRISQAGAQQESLDL